LLDHAPEEELKWAESHARFFAPKRVAGRVVRSGVFNMGLSLTVKRIERALRNPGRYYDAPPNGVRGLRLDVENKRNASGIFRYQRGGVDRVMGLGPLWKVELDEARELARAAWKLLDEGIDPIAARRAEKAKKAEALTFKAASESYYEQHQASWSNATHARQFLSSLAAFAYPVLVATCRSRPSTPRPCCEFWSRKSRPAAAYPNTARMTHSGSGVCIAAVETTMIFVDFEEQSWSTLARGERESHPLAGIRTI
jgi:hypothetical protein